VVSQKVNMFESYPKTLTHITFSCGAENVSLSNAMLSQLFISCPALRYLDLSYGKYSFFFAFFFLLFHGIFSFFTRFPFTFPIFFSIFFCFSFLFFFSFFSFFFFSLL